MTKRKKKAKAQGASEGKTGELRDLDAKGGEAVRGGAPSDWQSLKSYKVWDANSKTFIYPDNWLTP